MEKNKIPRSCGTHDGTFHADEITACALLILFNFIDEDKIVRTRDPHLLVNCEYVCDVGGFYDPAKKLFDHHQVDYQGPLSSAGMILQYLQSTVVLKSNEYDFFNQSLVMGVDAHDNGRDPLIPGYCSFSHVISNFTPISHNCTSEEQNEAFHRALQFTLQHLQRLWERFKYVRSCRAIVADCMEKYEGCLMFDENLPWMEIFFELDGISHPARFVIMPADHHWKLRGIPPSYEDRMKVRLPLPMEWAGLLDEDLKRVSGIPGAIFCHKGRFISVWETKEDALKALEYSLKHAEEKNMTTIFAKIINGELPSEKVFENERILAIKDLYPNAPVHILIMPKKEIPDLQSVSAEDLPLLAEICLVAQQLAEEFGIAKDGYRLLTNNGANAGQVVFHLHFHLLGGKRLGPIG